MIPPVKVILDTDMSGDCDDVGALSLLHKLVDQNEAEILACLVNGRDNDKAAAATISAVNTYYGRPTIPIGTYQGPGYPGTTSKYTAAVRDTFPHSARPDDQETKALDLFRATLAAAPDGSVVIVSIGFLINLRDLLESGPDQASPLTGLDLIKRKVRKMVLMGGVFPQSHPVHGEYNFAAQDGGPDTKQVIENWPTLILFSGCELGEPVITGAKLADAPSSNPARLAYELFTDFNGRPSWDLLTVLAAVKDPKLYWTLSEPGFCQVTPTGTNTWLSQPNGSHTYLITQMPHVEIASLMDEMLLLPPSL